MLTCRGEGVVMQPTPPAPTWLVAPRRSRALGAVDVAGLVVVFAVLAVADVIFVVLLRRTASDETAPVGLLATWSVVQVVVCVGAGSFQGMRRRRWWEIAIVATIASVLLALVVLVTADPAAGSADCASAGPCDTSFGFGAILICVFTFPVFAGLAAAGRALGGLVRRFRR